MINFGWIIITTLCRFVHKLQSVATNDGLVNKIFPWGGGGGSNVFNVTSNEFLTAGDYVCTTVKSEEF
jgi:hypothetical protein